MLLSDVNQSRPPDTMECLWFCNAWEAPSQASLANGVAKLYHGIGATWGFLEVAWSDSSGRVFTSDVSIEAHLHASSCSPDRDTVPDQQDVLLDNGEKFTWRLLPGHDNMMQSHTVYKTGVREAASVVVHAANAASHMCCNLKTCLPPAEHACLASCANWALADNTGATDVAGSAELWSNGSDSWMLVDVVFDPLNRAQELWKAPFEVSLLDGSPAELGGSWNSSARLVRSLPGSALVGHMRVEALHLPNLALPSRDRERSLVVSHAGQPLATCLLEACSGRSVPPPVAGRSTTGGGPGGAARDEGYASGQSWAVLGTTTVVVACVLTLVLRRRLSAGRQSPSNPLLRCSAYVDDVPAAPACQVAPAVICWDTCAKWQHPGELPSDTPSVLGRSGNSSGGPESSFKTVGRPHSRKQDPSASKPIGGLDTFDKGQAAADSDDNAVPAWESRASSRGGAWVPRVEGLSHKGNSNSERPGWRSPGAERSMCGHASLGCDGSWDRRAEDPPRLPVPFVEVPDCPDDSHESVGNSNGAGLGFRSSHSEWAPCRHPSCRTVEWFEEFMRLTMKAMGCLNNVVPPAAAPVARELSQLVRVRAGDGTRFRIQPLVEGSLYAWNAAAKLQEIVCHVQQLLLLLVACVAPRGVLDQSAAQLMLSSKYQSPLVVQHLAHMRAFCVAMAEGDLSAADVDHALRALTRLTVKLREHEVTAVQEAYCEVQKRQGCSSTPAVPAGIMRDMAACVSRLASYADLLRRRVHGIQQVAGMEAADIMQVLEQMQGQEDKLSNLARRLQLSCNPADFREFLPACQEAGQRGRVKMGFCFASNKPFSRTGQRIPIKLPCGCTVTHEKALELKACAKCCICHQPFLEKDFPLEVDHTLLRIVQLTIYGLHVPTFDRASILPGQVLAQGSHARICAAALKRGGGHEDVVLKEMALLPYLSERTPGQTAALHHCIATMLVASDNPHVCKLHGVCWKDDELWLVMERCDSSLSTFVRQVGSRRGAAGLPRIDVLVLGWMLLDALGTVHDYAKSLHLDVRPDNVLLPRRQAGACESAPRSIKLIDFGLGVSLATHVSHATRSYTVDHISSWTFGYAPPEQMDLRRTARASDVYAVAATMLFALTGQRPYGDSATMQGVIRNHVLEIPMDVPKSIPEDLRSLISDMTALRPTRRPTRLEAQRRIVRMYLQLQRRGEVAAYLAPHWGMPTREPSAAV